MTETDTKLQTTLTTQQNCLVKISAAPFCCPLKLTGSVLVMCFSSFFVTEIESDVLALGFFVFS